LIAALVVLYMGFSPVMTNSSLRLWSEFAAYPWVVLAVIGTIQSWRCLENSDEEHRGTIKIIGYGALVALMFVLIMSVKAVAEGILIFYLWPFYLKIYSYGRSGRAFKARQAAVFCLTVLVLFEGAACGYRWLNYQYNGNFAFTNRGDYAFYGNTARRMQPMTLRQWGAAAAFVPGLDICTSYFSQDECDFWSARHSDDLIGEKTNELRKLGVTPKEESRQYIQSSLRMILDNPLQAVLLMVIEAHKMFFWESSVAFVAYPDWLEKILYSPSFIKNTKFILAFLSWLGCVFSFVYLCLRRSSSLESQRERAAVFWVLNFIFWYSAMYSLFFVLDRYSFPLISLYMVLLAFIMQKTAVFLVKIKHGPSV
jgi:hypothetical protein